MADNGHARLFAAAGRVRRSTGKLHRLSSITPGELYVLCHILHLQQDHELRASELGTHMRMSRPAVSQVLRSLEKKHLIERVNSAEDRRVVYVHITDDGHQRYRELTAQISEKMDRVLGHIGPEKEEELTQILNELADAMDEELK
ncbi:MAG: MarR family transcriptional regulator [Oscillospiraceae bacterium]|nr:MarR family transcriptional regulator [Oscillospiraceae bacterium]